MRNLKLEDLGYNESLAQFIKENDLEEYEVGRVILAHKERYIVITEKGELECELLGNLRYSAKSSEDFPVVGDWLAVQEYDDGKGLIYEVYPRKNYLERKAVGREGEKQLIASNINFGFIVQSVNRDFSINRIERYLSICNSADIEAVIIINKIDLINIDELNEILDQLKSRIKDTKIICTSNLSGDGIKEVQAFIKKGSTYCLLGSSGVGKSTLINKLSGKEIMETAEISEAIDRGKHVTTHRELIVLESGALLIDNPGMREVGMTDSDHGLEVTFEEIYELTQECRFNDCSHINDKGCAVLEAVDTGVLSKETYDNFIKMKREQEHYSATVHEKRKKDKDFGKMVKRVMGEKNRNKR